MVNTQSEGQVLAGVVAMDVEVARLVEDMGIAIGADEHEDDCFAPPRTSRPRSSMGASAVRKVYCTGLT